MMKISNETKVGALTAITITLMVLGFNFLKGKSLLKTGNFIYAKFSDAKALTTSNPVYVNGFQIGSVYDIENDDANLKSISVAIKLKGEYNIPDNSVASISSNPLGTPSIEIALGNSTNKLTHGSIIKTVENEGLLGDLKNKFVPIADQLKSTTKTLDSVLKNINSIFDANAKNNLQGIVANINKTTASLIVSSASIETMLNQQSGSIAQSMNNVNSFTKNLTAQNDKINSTLGNLEKTSAQLAASDIAGSVNQLKGAIENLNGVIKKIDSKEGSLGLLVNDKTLYNNLTNTVRSANILMDDLKTHPKRYVNISVFGKKDKSAPLSAPINDTLTKNP